MYCRFMRSREYLTNVEIHRVLVRDFNKFVPILSAHDPGVFKVPDHKDPRFQGMSNFIVK